MVPIQWKCHGSELWRTVWENMFWWTMIVFPDALFQVLLFWFARAVQIMKWIYMSPWLLRAELADPPTLMNLTSGTVGITLENQLLEFQKGWRGIPRWQGKMVEEISLLKCKRQFSAGSCLVSSADLPSTGETVVALCLCYWVSLQYASQ